MTNSTKVTIIIAVAVLVVGGVVVAQELNDVTPSTVFTEVSKNTTNIIGEKYIHTFKDNETSEIKDVEISKAEYDALALKNASQPTLKEYTWVNSSEQSIMQTEITILKNLEFYVETASSTIRVKIPEHEKVISSEYMIDDKLTQAGIDELEK